jgi:hypothetical protein
VGVSLEALFESVKYTPHPGQMPYHNSSARFRIPCCGRRFGKSKMVATDAEKRLFQKSQFVWIAGPTYDLADREFRVIWDDLIVKQGLGRDKRVKKAYNKKQGEMYIRFPWGSFVEVRSAAHPDSLVGEGLDHIIVSEAAKLSEDIWDKYLRAALSDKRGGADFPSTPEGFNWYYDLYMQGLDPAMPEYASWRMPSWENTVVYPGGREDPEILLLERTMSAESFQQEIGADFASFVGKIYPEFSPETHVIDAIYRPAWKNYIFFDWGFVNPLAAIEVMVSPSDDVYIWREHYKSGMRLAEHLAELKRRPNPDGYHLEMCFGDAADPEAVAEVNASFGPCIAMPEAKTNWRSGIDLVKSFLKLEQVGEQDEFGTPLERPRLFVDRSCKNTIAEFNNYRTKDGTKHADAAEQAKKINDHAMDALRYGLVHLYQLGAQYHLSDVYTPAMDRGASGEFTLSGGASGFFTQGAKF